MSCTLNFLPTFSFIYMYIRQVTQLGDVPVVAARERPQIRLKSPWLDLLKNVNDSEVRKLAVNPNSVSSAGKRHRRFCQTIGPCSLRVAGSHFLVLIKYPQDIISRLLFVGVYNCRESWHVKWAVEIGACMWYRHLWLWLHTVCLSRWGLTPVLNQST